MSPPQVCEYLLTLGCPTLLATHFRQLEGLAALYPSCRLWRMAVGVERGALAYSWRLVPGDDGGGEGGQEEGGVLRHYGIALAREMGMPEALLARAAAVAGALEAEERARVRPRPGGGSGDDGAGDGGDADDAAALRAVYSLVHRLACVARQVGVTAAAGRGDGDAAAAAGQQEQGSGGGGGGAEGAAAAEEAAAAEVDPEALAAALPLLRELQAEAERLCFAC